MDPNGQWAAIVRWWVDEQQYKQTRFCVSYPDARDWIDYFIVQLENEDSETLLFPSWEIQSPDGPYESNPTLVI